MDKASQNVSRNVHLSLLSSRSAKVLFVVIFTALHMLLTVLFFLVSFSLVMGSADDAKPLSLMGEVIYALSKILQWPVIVPLGQVDFLREVLPVYSGVFILLLNSLVWSFVFLGLVLGLARSRQVINRATSRK